MAQKSKDIISRLADAGEEAISKVTEMPGAKGLAQSVNTMKDRLDDVTKKMRGIDAMEKRIAQLEKRLDQLQGTKGSSTRAVAKTTSASRTKKTSSTAKKRSSASAKKQS